MACPSLSATWRARRYLLLKIAEKGYTVDIYLHEKQMSMLDAIDEGTLKAKRVRKTKKNERKKK